MIIKISVIVFVVVYCLLSANNGVAFEINRKAYYLDQLPAQYVIPFVLITTDNVDQTLNSLTYPVIFKPNRCSGGGIEVKKIDNRQQAMTYLQSALKCGHPVVAQQYDRRAREFNVLYERHPLSTNGSVIAITERVPIGGNPKKEFLTYNLGYTERKCHVVDHSKQITPSFNYLIDQMTQRIPHFYVGRYDLKANSLEDLLAGRFGIIELNGVFGVDQRAYIKTMKDIHPYNLHLQLRWLMKRLLVGLQCNLLHGPLNIGRQIYADRITLCDPYVQRMKTVLCFNVFG